MILSFKDGAGEGDIPDGTFFALRGNAIIMSISCLTGETQTIKTLDEKYLPDSVKGGGGGGFILRPTAEEFEKLNDTIFMCTTNYDELAKKLEAGQHVNIVIPENVLGDGSGKVALSIMTWAYVEDAGLSIVVTPDTDGFKGIIFTNGTYIPKI